MGILIMKPILLVIALIVPVIVNAKPASQIAWTPEMLQNVKQGDLNKGKELATACAACHGEKGEGVKADIQDDETITAIPALAGQMATYTYKQLRDYVNGDRVNDAMTPLAKGLSEQDAADLAAWYASLKPLGNNQSSGRDFSKAEKMVTQGDGKRILPPCSVCHGGKGQGEKMDIPALAGQQADYFANALMAYKSGERHNDIYSRMRLIAQQLSDAEIRELAEYYQAAK